MMWLRRWLHHHGWLLSPSTAFFDAYRTAEATTRLLVCQSCMDGFGRRHDCDADRYCDCDDTGHHVPSPVVINWVQRGELPKYPTYIGICCREWVLPMVGYPGRCGLCDTAPTYLRPDALSLVLERAT